MKAFPCLKNSKAIHLSWALFLVFSLMASSCGKAVEGGKKNEAADSGENSPPLAMAQTVTTAEDTPVSLTLTGTTGNSSPLTFSIYAFPLHGTMKVQTKAVQDYATWIYTPEKDYNGTDSLWFFAKDGTGVQSSIPAEMKLMINPVQDRPVAQDYTLLLATTDKTSLLPTGKDADNDRISFRLISEPSKGTISGNYTGVLYSGTATGVHPDIYYTPNPGAEGSDSFSFVTNDGIEDSLPATITINLQKVIVTNNNNPPSAINGRLDTLVNVPATGFLFGEDSDGDKISYSILRNGDKGTATITDPSTGQYSYTPGVNESGGDSFTFRVFDGELYSTPMTISVAISQPSPDVETTIENHPPVAYSQTVKVFNGFPATIKSLATDEDGDELKFEMISYPQKRDYNFCDFWHNGTLHYQNKRGTSGTDSYTFRFYDGKSFSNTATVDIVITDYDYTETDGYNEPGNTAPTVSDYSFTIAEDNSYLYHLPVTDFESSELNIHDSFAHLLFCVVLTPPAHGRLWSVRPYSPCRSITYIPDPNFSGEDSYTFVATDTMLISKPATVNIKVTPVNEPPEIVNGNLSVGSVSGPFSDWGGYLLEASLFQDTAMVSAVEFPGDLSKLTKKVCVLERDSSGNWSKVSELAPPEESARFTFGDSVSLQGDTALVSAPGFSIDNNLEGIPPEGIHHVAAVYAYERQPDNTWKMIQKLPVETAVDHKYQYIVSHSGDTAILSDGATHGNPGYAYFFERQSDGAWANSQKTSISGEGYDTVLDVSIDGNTAVIAWGHASSQIIFLERQPDGTWIKTQKLSTDIIRSISLDGDILAAGAFDGIYIFERQKDGVWIEKQKLTKEIVHSNIYTDTSPNFSRNVSLNGDILLAGANWDSTEFTENSGAAYLFKRLADGNWVNFKKLTAPDSEKHDYFGGGVSLFGDTVLVGKSYWYSGDGKVYFFKTHDMELHTSEKLPVTYTLAATDINEDPVTFVTKIQPLHGTVAWDPASTGQLTYTPNDGFTGKDYFSVTAFDGEDQSNPYNFEVTVTPTP